MICMAAPPLKKVCLAASNHAEPLLTGIRYGQCYLISLPSELLVAILSFLCARDKFHLRLTCRRLHLLLSDSIFWKIIFWRDYFPPREERTLRCVMQLGVSSLTKLSIFGYGTFALSKFKSILVSCIHLESITLMGFTLSESQLAALLLSTSARYLEVEVAEKESKQVMEILTASQLTSVLLHINRTLDVAMLAKIWSNAGYFPSDVTFCSRYNSGMSVAHVQFALVNILGSLPSCGHKARLAVGYSSIHTHIKQATMQPFCEIVNKKLGFEFSQVSCNELGLSTYVLSLTQSNIMSVGYSAGYVHNVRPTFLDRSVPQDIAMLENITELCLANLQELSSHHLTIISHSCCHLVRLNIQKCTKSLSDLSGLSNIITHCCNLRGLNLDLIHFQEVECVIKLWEVLAKSKHLSHLRFCCCMVYLSKIVPQHATPDNDHSRVSRIIQQTPDVEVVQAFIRKLTTIDTLELICHVPRIQDDRTTFQILSCFQLVQHLQLEGSPHNVDILKEVFPSLRLSSIHIHISTRHLLKVPFDPACYQNLQKIAIMAPLYPTAIVINQSIASALTSAKKLTHVYIAACFDTPHAITTIIFESPWLMDFFLTGKLQCTSLTSRTSVKKLEKSVKSELSKKKVRHQITLYVQLWPTNVSQSINEAMSLTELSSSWISKDC